MQNNITASESGKPQKMAQMLENNKPTAKENLLNKVFFLIGHFKLCKK